MCKGRVVAGPTVEGRSAVLCHRVPHLGGAISRCRPAQVALGVFRCRCLSLRRVAYPVVVLAAALPCLARVGWSEAIRDRGHEIVLVRVDFVVVAKDIGVAQPPRWLVVVAVASVHDAELSLRATKARSSPLSVLPASDAVVSSYFCSMRCALCSDGWRACSECGANWRVSCRGVGSGEKVHHVWQRLS